MGRRPMGSYCVSGEGTHRDHEILSGRPAAYLDLQSRLRGLTQQRCLRQRHGADRAPGVAPPILGPRTVQSPGRTTHRAKRAQPGGRTASQMMDGSPLLVLARLVFGIPALSVATPLTTRLLWHVVQVAALTCGSTRSLHSPTSIVSRAANSHILTLVPTRVTTLRSSSSAWRVQTLHRSNGPAR